MSQPRRTGGRLLGSVLFAVALTGTVSAQNDKRFFIGPTPSSGLTEYTHLFDANADWDWVQRQGTVFEFHNNSLIPNPLNPSYLEDHVLLRAVATLEKSSMATAVIAGGLRPLTTTTDPGTWSLAGETTANVEFTGFRRWTNLGGKIDVLLLDSPFSKMKTGTNMPWDVAAGELADYLDLLDQYFPDIEVGFTEPVPRYTIEGYQTFNQIDFGDLDQLLDTVLPILKARGHQMSFFLADSPFRFNQGTPNGWKKLVAVQQNVKARGLRFGWFINDDLASGATDAMYYRNCQKALKRFLNAGGDADDFNFRSWYEYPAFAVPETQPYSFTWNAQELMKYVYGNFVATNPHNITMTFDDGSLGPLVLQGGSPTIQEGRIDASTDTAFTIPSPRYEAPGVTVGGDMTGMGPGSEVSVSMEPATGSWNYEVVVVADAGSNGHAELRAENKATGAGTLLETGSPFPLYGPVWSYHLSMRVLDGELTVMVNDVPSMRTKSPLPGGSPQVQLGLRLENPNGFTGRMSIDYLDVRDKNATTSVTIDGENYAIFSIYQPRLSDTFDKTYFLNGLYGTVFNFNQFATVVFPYLKVHGVSGDYLITRSNFALPPGSLVSLVYDGDFETELVE